MSSMILWVAFDKGLWVLSEPDAGRLSERKALWVEGWAKGTSMEVIYRQSYHHTSQRNLCSLPMDVKIHQEKPIRSPISNAWYFSIASPSLMRTPAASILTSFSSPPSSPLVLWKTPLTHSLVSTSSLL